MRLERTTTAPVTMAVVATSATRVGSTGRWVRPFPLTSARLAPAAGTGRSPAASANRAAAAICGAPPSAGGSTHRRATMAAQAQTTTKATITPVTSTGQSARTPLTASARRAMPIGRSGEAATATSIPMRTPTLNAGPTLRRPARRRSRGERPIDASTCESSRRGARCRPIAWAMASTPAAATTAAAMSRPMRCNSAARCAPCTSALVASTSPLSTSGDSSEMTAAASAGSRRCSHRMVPMLAPSGKSARDEPRARPPRARRSTDHRRGRTGAGRSRRRGRRRRVARSNDSSETSASIVVRVPTSNPYCSAARSLTMISTVLPGSGYRPAISIGCPSPPGDEPSLPTSV